MLGMVVNTLFPQDQNALDVKASDTWNKSALSLKMILTIGKRKALAATLSDTEPENDSDNEDNGILNAFTATVNPT